MVPWLTDKVEPGATWRASRRRSFDDAFALTTTTRRLRDLLPLLDRRLHVMTPLLQLTQEAFSRKLTLEVLDCSLDTLAVDDDLQGLALYGFARVRQGTGTFANLCMESKSRSCPKAARQSLFSNCRPIGRWSAGESSERGRGPRRAYIGVCGPHDAEPGARSRLVRRVRRPARALRRRRCTRSRARASGCAARARTPACRRCARRRRRWGGRGRRRRRARSRGPP
jgi:hypothetical protein